MAGPQMGVRHRRAGPLTALRHHYCPTCETGHDTSQRTRSRALWRGGPQSRPRMQHCYRGWLPSRVCERQEGPQAAAPGTPRSSGCAKPGPGGCKRQGGDGGVEGSSRQPAVPGEAGIRLPITRTIRAH